MSIHPYFHQVAQQWLEDQQLPESLVKRYVIELAERLEDDAEDFLGTLAVTNFKLFERHLGRARARTHRSRPRRLHRPTDLDELRGK